MVHRVTRDSLSRTCSWIHEKAAELFHPRRGLLTLPLLAVLLCSLSLKPAQAITHGLVGKYYISELTINSPTEHPFYFTQIWINHDDFLLPEPLTDPAATRVDPQIAFGQGSGFKNPPIPRHGAGWAPSGYPNPTGFTATDHKPWTFFGAAVWEGFIHLPKAGTYYFATVSEGPSAVYLNQARVALNGMQSHYGRLLWSDNFSYDPADVQDFVQNVRGTPNGLRQDAYALPVTVDGPRDLPIKVRYNGTDAGFIGIDLFWVTPDSPKDSNGKPIAKLVPSDVLYTEAPGPIAPSVVRGANSTISSDLYCSGVQETKPLTLMFRLADKNGHPVSGKRVIFTTLSNEDFGFNDLVQPDKPTDENGITTAKLKSRPDARPHATAIYATDMTDLVDIAQVAHVRFPEVKPGFFASPCTSGYDPNLITVEPLPLVVGRPVTLRVKLENRFKTNVELNATFQATDWNIGANTWKDIGHVDNIPLKSGETKDVSMNWTPTAEQVHQCFKVRLSGKATRASRTTPPKAMLAAAVPSLLVLQDLGDVEDQVKRVLNFEPLSAAQRNMSGVITCNPTVMALYTLTGHGVMKQCFQPSATGEMSSNRLPNMPPLNQPPTGASGASANAKPSPPGGSTTTSTTNPPSPGGQTGSDAGGSGPSPKVAATNLGATVAYRYKILCDQYAARLLAPPPQPVQPSWGIWLRAYRECETDRTAWRHLSQDPPARQYRGLAVAQSDTTAAYLNAAQTSMERYGAAQANGDDDWAARHLKAMQLYLKRAADAERHAADEEQKQSEQPPPQDVNDIASLQTVVNDWTARARRGVLPQDGLAKLQSQGLSADEAKAFAADLASYDQPLQLSNARSVLLDSASLQKNVADQAEHISTLSPDQGLAGESFQQTYQVFNPHDKEETVDLFVQPLSMPPSWKVYIANVLEPGAGEQSDATLKSRAKYPVTEVQEGSHYSVTLPGKTGVQLASVLIPTGDVGANTTARWAVEGQIRGEAIGTMVHEMTVPYVVAELNLPAVGSKEEMDEGQPMTAPGAKHLPLPVIIVIVTIALFFILFLLFWRRRRKEEPAG